MTNHNEKSPVLWKHFLSKQKVKKRRTELYFYTVLDATLFYFKIKTKFTNWDLIRLKSNSVLDRESTLLLFQGYSKTFQRLFKCFPGLFKEFSRLFQGAQADSKMTIFLSKCVISRHISTRLNLVKTRRISPC